MKKDKVNIPAGKYKQAIEVFEILNKAYKVKFSISYNHYGNAGTAGWNVKTMGKNFSSVESFVTAAAKAIEFVYNAHKQHTSQ